MYPKETFLQGNFTYVDAEYVGMYNEFVTSGTSLAIKKTFKRLKSESIILNCATYDIFFDKCYRRGWIFGDETIRFLENYTETNLGTYLYQPSFVTERATVTINKCHCCIREDIEKLQNEFRDYMTIKKTDMIYEFETKNPDKYIIEFSPTSHNNGLDVHIIMLNK